ncbi:GDSL-type esterase/lipase family protein [Bradyrhizobium japonicum]
MRRAFPWILSVVLLIAALGAVYAFRPLSYPEKREKMIFADLRQARDPIIVFGDSITELAKLPQRLCGHPVINAGIGGLRIKDFDTIAPRISEQHRPFMVVVALGANDRGSEDAGADTSRLLRLLRDRSDKIISLSVTPDPKTDDLMRRANEGAEISYVDTHIEETDRRDGVHLNAGGATNFCPRWLPQSKPNAVR